MGGNTRFSAPSGAVPAGTATASVNISDDGSTITYTVTYSNLSGPAAAAHIHVGEIGVNGPIILPLTVGASPMTGTLTSDNFTSANGLTYQQAVDKIKSGGTYVNIHTAAHPGGEIRGQLYDSAAPQTYVVAADAPQAVPAGHVWGFNDFFPRTLTVAQGSILKFAIKGFHTATILPQGVTAAQDFANHQGVVVADSDDSAPNPNGALPVVLNIPALVQIPPSPTCGTDATPCSFDGTAVVNASPLVQAAPGPPPGRPVRHRQPSRLTPRLGPTSSTAASTPR